MIGTIKYGDVQLELTKVNDVRREVILSDDGVDYLYTSITVDVMATLNPNATSYISLGVDPGKTRPTEGFAFAGRTDRIISDYLAQPRRKFVMWVYDEDHSKRVYLETPPGNMACDAKNGPFCKVFSIQEVHGARTWMMHLQFTTFVNNCYDKDSPILSHRWERNIDYDEQFRAIITTSGTVMFHAGRLFSEKPAQSPDFYREQFFQAPPENFAREHVNVNVASDNTSCRYTVVDVERFFNVGGFGDSPGVSEAVKLEASLSTWTSQGSVINVATQPSVQSAFWNLFPNFDNRSEGPGVKLFKFLMASNSASVDELPKYYANIKVRAHGARNSSRRKLADLAMAVAFSRLGTPTFWTLANRTEMILNQDLADTFVEFDMTLRWMDSQLVQLAGGLPFPALTAGGSVIALIADSDRTRNFLNSYLGPAPDSIDPTGNNTVMQPRTSVVAPGNIPPPAAPLQPAAFPAGRPLLDQGFAPGAVALSLKNNRPMNTDPNRIEHRHNRGIGYVKKVMVQALKGSCDVPPIPGIIFDVYQKDVWDRASTAEPAVQKRTFPLLPAV